MSDPKKYEGWIAVFSSGTDFEADLVRDRIDDAGIPAVVLTQRDHAFNLTVGDLAPAEEDRQGAIHSPLTPGADSHLRG